MSNATPSGPPVADHEMLYRALTHSTWWKPDVKQPSSAAFNWPRFSVDIASLTRPEDTLARVRHISANSGVVQFNSGAARQLDFDARQELDVNYPDNQAHAHVYTLVPSRQRKKRAQALAQTCQVVIEPGFPVGP